MVTEWGESNSLRVELAGLDVYLIWTISLCLIYSGMNDTIFHDQGSFLIRHSPGFFQVHENNVRCNQFGSMYTMTTQQQYSRHVMLMASKIVASNHT